MAERSIKNKGKLVKELRLEKDLKQKVVSEATGIPAPTLSLIEKDKTGMTVEEYKTLMNYYDQEIDPTVLQKPTEEVRVAKKKEVTAARPSKKAAKKNTEEKKKETIEKQSEKKKKVAKKEEKKDILDGVDIDEYDDDYEDTDDIFGTVTEDEDADSLKTEGTDITLKDARISRSEMDKLKTSVIDMSAESKDSIRILVDMYYQMQSLRIASDNRARAVAQGFDKSQDSNPPAAIIWSANQFRYMEKSTKELLATYTKTSKVGLWLNSIVGIGPCISAGLMAYYTVNENMKSCSNFWTYAGLNDNNIPWLGTAKARKVMRETREIVTRRCQDRMKSYKSLAEASTRKEVKKILKIGNIDQIFVERTRYDTLADALITNGIDPVVVELVIHDCKVYDNGINTYYNTIKYLYDKVHPTNEFMYLIAKSLNRSYKTVVNGAINKKKNARTYERLEKFIAMPPYNVSLKKLCYKIGSSFIKQESRGSMYGRLFYARKEYETKKNERGDYKEQAYKLLRTKNIKKKEIVEQLKAGRLGKGHIAMRAMRWTVKLFISHLFDAMYIDAYGRTPEKTYPFQDGNHIDWIAPEVPYETFWPGYKDTRVYGSISRTYTPDYTYSFGGPADEQNYTSDDPMFMEDLNAIQDIVYDRNYNDPDYVLESEEEEEE